MSARTTDSEANNNSKRQKLKYAILAGLVLFALALCAAVIIMMLIRGPAVTY